MKRPLRQRAEKLMADAARPKVYGRVVRVVGLLVEAHVPDAKIGDLARIDRGDGIIQAEVVGFRGDLALLVPLDHLRGVAPGAPVTLGEGGA